jgi:hypothetical protein
MPLNSIILLFRWNRFQRSYPSQPPRKVCDRTNRAAAWHRDIPPVIAFITFSRISIDSAMISSRPLVAFKPNDRYS